MIIKNRLGELLISFGIKSMVPSPALLQKLGGMTLHRFNQIVANTSRTEMSVLEASYLKDWLGEITHQEPSNIALLESELAVGQTSWENN